VAEFFHVRYPSRVSELDRGTLQLRICSRLSADVCHPANTTRIRQSRPDSGLGFRHFFPGEPFRPFQLFPSRFREQSLEGGVLVISRCSPADTNTAAMYACNRAETVFEGLGFLILGCGVLVEVLKFRVRGFSVIGLGFGVLCCGF
jgi:hypothetical protein